MRRLEQAFWVTSALVWVASFLVPEVDPTAHTAVIPALIAAGAAIGSGVIGAQQASSDRDQAREFIQQSIRDLEAIGIPSVEAQQIALEQYQSVGNVDPELEQQIKLGDSSMLGVSTDPQYKERQLQALSKLSEISDGGGMSLTDRANLEKIQGNLQADERGSREAILSRMRARGQGGSGMELTAQLMNQQNSANQANQAGLQMAGMAQQRGLDAIIQGGQLSGQFRDQDFGEKERIAKAQDSIAQWNAQNAQGVNQRNAGYANDARYYNHGNNQQIANSNVDTDNKEHTYNKGLIQQDFENRYKLGAAKSNARAGQATQANNSANATAGMWAGIGSSAAQGVAAAGQYANRNATQATAQDDQKKKLMTGQQ